VGKTYGEGGGASKENTDSIPDHELVRKSVKSARFNQRDLKVI